MEFDFDAIRQAVTQTIPHVRALGADLASLEDDKVTLRLDYDPRLVGNPETGVLHGGVITTLLDTVSGFAVFIALKRFLPIATLDLRMDYLRPAAPKLPLFAWARCDRLTRHIAFCRGAAYQEDQDDPVALAAATFMITQPPRTPQATAGNP